MYKLLLSKGKTVILLLSLSILCNVTVFAQEICDDEIIQQDGYTFEYWKDQGSGCMTINDNGFYVNWSNINNLLARKGVRPGSMEQLFTYAANYQPNGNSYLCIYGWTTDPLVEYYIIESFGSWDPSSQGSYRGSVSSDGGTYNLYESTRVNQPSILGDTTFQQYWSIRQNKRTSGTITVANHFQAWQQAGMPMGDLYEVSFTVEGYQSSGTCDVYQLDISTGFPEDPNLEITSLTRRQAFDLGDEITINANASAKQGTITNVEFFIEGNKIGEDNSAPYSFSWIADRSGVVEVSVVASDSEGWDAERVVPIIVREPQGPYGGVPHALPGTFEFEHFDVGGPEVAYHETSEGGSVGIDFRSNEDVDIEECGEGGYSLGYTVAGEWLEYTVNAAGAGTYNMELRVACNESGRSLSVSSDGNPIASNITIPNTGAWQTYQTVSREVELPAGEQVLRFTIGDQDYVNMNYATFTAIDIVLPIDSCPDDDSKIVPGECGCGVPEGTCDEPVYTDTLHLKAGWNMIGSPYVNDISIQDMMLDAFQYVEVVKDLSGFYDSSIDPSLNSLTELKFGMGYFVKVSQDCELLLE